MHKKLDTWIRWKIEYLNSDGIQPSRYSCVMQITSGHPSFETDYLFHDICCMCVVQIGELVGQLSDDVNKSSPSIPWHAF